MTTFSKLGLSTEINRVLEELGFEKPTDIQKKAIPPLLSDYRDFIGLAQTGTGKTAAFGLPLLERVDPTDHYIQALVLAPTRELGQQIAAQLFSFSKYVDGLRMLAVYGGASISDQMKALKKPTQILIATPGRLIDLMKRRAVKLDQLRYLVFDEADEMLNMGFKDAIDEILVGTPSDKLTWLFSATMPPEIARIVKQYMTDPIRVELNVAHEINTNITHQYVVVKEADKKEALIRFMDLMPDMKGVVFCRTRRDTQELAEHLMKKDYRADSLHGDLSQAQRDRVMKRFKNHDLHLLIATDVAARGIDVSDLTHVFHYALPEDIAYYTHRSGRTARAGKRGISLALINGREGYKIRNIEKQLSVKFEKVDVPHTEAIAEIRIENLCHQLIAQRSRQVDPVVLERVSLILGNLSKDELMAKWVATEMQRMNLGASRDLNIPHETKSSGEHRDHNSRKRKNYSKNRGNRRFRGKKK